MGDGTETAETSFAPPTDATSRESYPYQFGQSTAGTAQPFFYGVLMAGPSVAVLPWGHPGLFVFAGLQLALLTVKMRSDRLAPIAFTALALSAACYSLAGWPASVWHAGTLAVVLIWGVTGKRAGWARWCGALTPLLFVAALLGLGDKTLLSGLAPTTGNHVGEAIRMAVLLLICSSGLSFRRLLETAKEERKAAVAEAATAERARIARELHDVVSHHVTVMVLQAEGARAASTESAVTKALGQVVTTGRTALNELRRLLGVLRQPDVEPAPELEPQPDLDQLPALLDQLRGAGLRVDYQVTGDPWPADPGIGLSAYRIVQEALTNSLRHSGGDAAHIRLTYEADALIVEVVDEGGSRVRLRGGSGTGLVGMQERAAAVGGTVDAGPNGRGYAVRARLPRS